MTEITLKEDHWQVSLEIKGQIFADWNYKKEADAKWKFEKLKKKRQDCFKSLTLSHNCYVDEDTGLYKEYFDYEDFKKR